MRPDLKTGFCPRARPCSLTVHHRAVLARWRSDARGFPLAMRVSFVCLWSCAAALRAVPPTRACVSMSSSARAFTPNTPRDGGVISEPAAQWALGQVSSCGCRTFFYSCHPKQALAGVGQPRGRAGV